MTGIVVGDLHAGLVYKGIVFNDKILKCILQVYRYIKQNKQIKMLVLLGDIFHNAKYSMDTIVLVASILNKLDTLGIKVYVLEGNHDKKCFGLDRKSTFSILEHMKFKNTKLIRTITYYPDIESKTTFIFIPYFDKNNIVEFSGSNVQEFLNFEARRVLNKLKSKYQLHTFVVFSHLAVKGVKSGSEVEWVTTNDLQIPNCILTEKKVKSIFNGHIHLPQEKGRVIMPGSIESFRFGEGYKRYFVEFKT